MGTHTAVVTVCIVTINRFGRSMRNSAISTAVNLVHKIIAVEIFNFPIIYYMLIFRSIFNVNVKQKTVWYLVFLLFFFGNNFAEKVNKICPKYRNMFVPRWGQWYVVGLLTGSVVCCWSIDGVSGMLLAYWRGQWYVVGLLTGSVVCCWSPDGVSGMLLVSWRSQWYVVGLLTGQWCVVGPLTGQWSVVGPLTGSVVCWSPYGVSGMWLV